MREWYLKFDNSGNPSPEEVKEILMGSTAPIGSQPTPSFRVGSTNVFYMEPRSAGDKDRLRALTRADERCPTCGRLSECCCTKEQRRQVHAQSALMGPEF